MTSADVNASPGHSPIARGADSPSAHPLPFVFDAGPIAAEVAALPASCWVPHFNKAIHSGDWSGVALRSIGGQVGSIYPEAAGGREWADTLILEHCPATAAVLARFECPLTSVRFLRLGAGATIRPHNDPALGYHFGEARLHLPIVSDEAVSFWLDSEPVSMATGECWYLDLNLEHAAANEGTEARVHLVIDCVVDPWLEALFGYERVTPAAGGTAN